MDAIADQIGALSVDEVASALEGLFAQLSAEGDVDAIADQIGALSVDEIATELEGLLAAQLDAEAENRRSGAEVMHALVNDGVDMYNYASRNFFPQLEADDEDELAQLSAEDTLDDMLDVAFNVGMTVAPMAASAAFAQVD